LGCLQGLLSSADLGVWPKLDVRASSRPCLGNAGEGLGAKPRAASFCKSLVVSDPSSTTTCELRRKEIDGKACVVTLPRTGVKLKVSQLLPLSLASSRILLQFGSSILFTRDSQARDRSPLRCVMPLRCVPQTPAAPPGPGRGPGPRPPNAPFMGPSRPPVRVSEYTLSIRCRRHD
jgi:hypothetical protein